MYFIKVTNLLRIVGIYLEAYSGGVVCLSASYPLKELPALRPLYINHEMFFVTHLRHEHADGFPP